MLKKILKYTGFTLLGLIALAFIIPVVFKKQIKALVKKEINKSLNAKVEFSDVSLSLFRHFPRVGIIVEDVSIVGSGTFAGDTLLAAKKIDASAGLFSVLKGSNIKVNSITFVSPRIHALMDESGNANWNIARPSAPASGNSDTSTSAFKLTLKKYSISDGYLLYRDEKNNTFTELTGLNHTGSGDLTADEFTLYTNTTADAASFTQDNIPYLINTKTQINTDIKINTKNSTYAFKTEKVQLNNLRLNLDGFIQLVNDSTFKTDVTFTTPSNDFKDILSMIPAVYKKDFADIKTTGSATFTGFVKGTYTPSLLPAYRVNLSVKDASFQYPDLPKPVKNIQLSLIAANEDGNPDHSVIDIAKGHLEMDNEPFDFRFLYKNPVSTQWIDAAANGKLDLSQLTKFIKLDKNIRLSGLVWADAFVKGPLKSLQLQSGPFTAGGFFDIKNLYYAARDFPQPISNGNIRATLTNTGGIADKTVVDVQSAHIELGKDPIDFSLQLRNPVSSVDFAGHVRGRFTLDNLKQFASLSPGTAISGQLTADMDIAGSKQFIERAQYDKINLKGTGGLSNTIYKTKEYPSGITINNAALNFNASTISLSSLKGSYLSSNLAATGSLNNLVGYMMKGEGLTGSLQLEADKINLNDWMGTTSSGPSDKPVATSPSTADPFLVPKGMNISLHADAGKVTYDKVDYNNVNGVLLLNDETITLRDVKTTALEGNVLLNGTYSTRRSKQEPDISINYDIQNMDVQQAFLSYNTIRFLMPIGKFLAGKLNSQLNLSGKLGGDMMPELSSLSGKGNLLLLKGVLQKFAPLEKLAEVLQIDRLKSISVKEIKNYIEFANGKVLVKPFKLKIDDIEMEIGGFHGFDQSIDYAIQMKLPRSVMGNKGNALVNNLVTEATSKGLPLKLGETINLHIKMTGSITSPSMAVNLKEMAADAIKDLEQQAKDFVQAKLDSAKQRTKDSIQEIKKQVEDKLKEKVKEKLFGKDTTQTPDIPKDTTPAKPGEGIKKKIKDIFNRVKKPAGDSL